MALEFLSQPYVYGNAQGLNALAKALTDAYSRQCEMFVFGSSLQAAPFGSGTAWYASFLGEIINTYGHVAGTNWVTTQAKSDHESLTVELQTGASYSVDIIVEDNKHLFPPGIGNQNSTTLENGYRLGVLSGSGSFNDEGVRVSLRSPASLDTGVGVGVHWDWANTYASLTAETWQPVDISEGAVLEVLTCNYPGKTGITMYAELRPIDPDCGYDAVTDARITNMSPVRNEQSVDLSSEDDVLGTGFHKHAFTFAPLATYDAGDAGRIYNARVRASPGNTTYGAAALCTRWRSRVDKSWLVTTFGVGGTTLDHVFETHSDCGPCLKAMGTPDVIYTRTGQNDFDTARSVFRGNLYGWYEFVNGIFPSAVVVIGTDPDSEGADTYQGNDIDNYFTDMMALVDSTSRPVVAINTRRVSYERGLRAGGSLDPVDGTGAWQSDETHPNATAGAPGMAAIEWALMLGAAANRPRIYKRVGIR